MFSIQYEYLQYSDKITGMRTRNSNSNLNTRSIFLRMLFQIFCADMRDFSPRTTPNGDLQLSYFLKKSTEWGLYIRHCGAHTEEHTVRPFSCSPCFSIRT